MNIMRLFKPVAIAARLEQALSYERTAENSIASRCFSASIAALQPAPAAVMAC